MSKGSLQDAASLYSGHADTLSVNLQGVVFSGYDERVNLPAPGRSPGFCDIETAEQVVAVADAMIARWTDLRATWSEQVKEKAETPEGASRS